MLALLAVMPAARAADPSAAARDRDEFYWLGEFNKASTVMTVERGIVPRPLGARIAHAVAQVIADGAQPGARRPADYLQVEPLITAIAGPDATRMHSGRSRQDILATTRRVMQRDRVLDLMDAMDAARVRLLALARANAATVIPAYTNGVQAQPTTFGHYLLGFAAALDRDGERLRQAWVRLNLSPMGGAALGTSSFPVDRPRLAELLGFEGVDENSYGATQLAPLDEGAELAGIVTTAALLVGALAQDIHTQYHESRPWLMLQEGALTGPSSIMPQKRNPYGLNLLRLQASDAVGAAQAWVVEAHNVAPGMPDYKRNGPERALEASTEMFARLSRVLDGLVVLPDRALAEVEADYSTTTELADTLQREADVPFRIGHHFASDLVTFGRGHDLTGAQIPFADAQRIYTEAARAFGQQDARLPLTEERFRRSLSARGMLEASQGLGGPQPAEVAHMLDGARARLASDQAWAAAERASLHDAAARLDQAFGSLMDAP